MKKLEYMEKLLGEAIYGKTIESYAVKPLARAPKGLFDGDNFMTPNLLGFYKLRDGYAELSEGRGMNNQPIFGVTVRPEPAEYEKRRSRLFQSKSAAMEYIETLTA